jgi:Fe(3+) dicitrate transport protein
VGIEGIHIIFIIHLVIESIVLILKYNNISTNRTALTQWVPGLGAAFNPNRRLTVFAGVHRGFAPPRTEDIISNSTGGVVELDPALSWNSELGLRAAPAEGIRVDATVFRMDYENQVVPASLAGGLGATLTNGGQTLHQGAEASIRVNGAALMRSAHDPYVRLSATWLPVARFEGVRSSAVGGAAGVSVTGNRLPYVPERSLTASIGYTHPSGLDAMVEAVHVSDQFADDLNTREPSADGQRGLIPASVVWNATVAYAWKPRHATVFVAVKNVADATFIVDRSRGILPGSPRLIHAGLKLAF